MKIVTGGQTGVDLAAFQFALENDIPYGGWVPKGRLNEAGRIPDRYTGLTETHSEDVAERTKRNVLASDALLVFADGSPSPGTQLTIDFAKEIGKPCLIVDVRQGCEACARQVRRWLMARPNAVLNIAGPRQSEAPEIGTKVTAVLRQSIMPEGS
ncbi:putative molybdenum carrier protein [Ruegeria atlantica]|uniref:putative molybdenum carrier protein n=1 Tax=Ruegeria atlantica TaxID=81569 RepID=UPI00147FB854